MASAINAKRRKHIGKPRTLYGDPDSYFVREVGNAAYTGQSEPYINPETGELLPGFEVFADDTWSESDDEPARKEFKRKLNQVKIKTDWLGTFDQGSLELLFQEFSQVGFAKEAKEAEVLMLGPDALEDPTALITEAKGGLKNCIFKPRLTCIDDTSEFESVSESELESSELSKSSSESEFVPLGPPRHSFYFEFDALVLGDPLGPYEMNEASSDYLHDVYINCVDPDDEGIDFDGDIPKEICALIEWEDESHAQPLKEEVISLNFKDENDPSMVQVGSTLSPEEHHDFKELLTEYNDIFARPHQDMPVKLISRMDPLKYLFEKPALTGKLARWLLMLAEFDLEYVTRKSVKGRAVAEFLADHPVDGPEDSDFVFLNEEVLTVVDDVWTLYFDGAANQKGYGIGVLLITPDGSHIPLAFKLNFDVTNNQAEYEAYIVGMEAALTLGVEKLEVIGDSNLVVSQANGDWKVLEE
ncbi:hypothetical protein RHMOL_Rhmol02G0180800 [Rhododendron molle]|uniref:Uncharacterized protein n=1 Tax=Rhododendron molle TaxID=49168 RepID=A0ACC0PSU2_RHOML|nr:hypothetical protein RHMOL_Rhmol02G0180800 [Rhododendron molle]